MSASPIGPAASRAIAQVLTGGILLGCALLALGGILAAFQGGLGTGAGLGSGGFAVHGIFRLEPVALLRAGILVLILTPIVRIAGVAVLLGRRQDLAGVIYSVTVLLLLALATALDVRAN